MILPMTINPILLGKTPCYFSTTPARHEFVTLDGEPHVCIRNVDRLEPFLLNIVSASDCWLFVGSNSPFTAGRIDPDTALFPYQTVDKILRHADTAGALTVLLVQRGDTWALWEPWRPSGLAYRSERHLYKHIYGTSVVFEEINHDLGLRFRWSLSTGEPFGLIRHCHLENTGPTPVAVRYLDGFHQLIAPGVTQETFARFSYLAAGYMRHERHGALGIFTLNGPIVDHPEPAESLRAAAAWSVGHAAPVVLLSTRQLEIFRQGSAVQPESEIRGDFGAYLVAAATTLAPGQPHTWYTVADTRLDHAALHRLRVLPDHAALERSVAGNRAAVRRRIAAADGLQHTGDPAASVHHFANVLFNCLRGGTFEDSYRFPSADFADYVHRHHQALRVPTLPATLTRAELLAAIDEPQLTRLARAYLPLTFSRRHGDPSRPWNRFEIRGNEFNYQGNWRDIFQNWESLAQSYPGWLDAMIAVFLNASTADGYNPYRITRNGIDWETPEPGNPWSHLGYWGDHQIIYLLRLLESQERFFPGSLANQLASPSYASARVPYEIAGFDQLLADPRHTITFNRSLHDQLLARAQEHGADSKLVTDANGDVLLVSLAEKLLVPALVKLSNLIPGSGIWLNTQRPEWNDANNALAGWGLSMVTVCHLRRYLAFCEKLFAGNGTVPLTAPVAAFLDQLTGILRHPDFRKLGQAGATHRRAVYAQEFGPRRDIPLAAVREFIAVAQSVIETTIRANRRADGLYHSYNLLHVTGHQAQVTHLYPMLEGQVAVLSSGLLHRDEALDVVRALRASPLYRPDQHSYLLYPDRELPAFLDRNTLPGPPPLADRSLFTPDDRGRWHFQADLRNAGDVARQLDRLSVDPSTRAAVLELWETIFRHHEFTGRSGTFFMFEGLGSIYWHMIAKLLLAVQENALPEAYAEIRNGLGFRKTPAVYGAFPTDPYSHTPAHRGAQQPGMTGQVKEEILTRWGELGVEVVAGCLRFAPRLLTPSEFCREPYQFAYLDLRGHEQTWDLPSQSLAFTFCQVPVCYRLAKTPNITIERGDGRRDSLASATLNRELSLGIFHRTGVIARLLVDVPADSFCGAGG
jgi:hypothetical protein